MIHRARSLRRAGHWLHGTAPSAAAPYNADLTRHHGMKKEHTGSSRQRYRKFVDDYRHRRLDDEVESGQKPPDGEPKDDASRAAETKTSGFKSLSGKRRE